MEAIKITHIKNLEPKRQIFKTLLQAWTKGKNCLEPEQNALFAHLALQ